MNIRRPATLIAVVLLLVMAAACSEDTKVGSGVGEFESAEGGPRLGETTTTVAPPPAETTVAPPVTAASGPATTARPTQTTKAPVQTTAAPATTAPSSITVKIQGDGQGNAFEPSNTRAFANSTIRFQNVDTAPHQVRSRNGEFQSPSLAPGASWDFKLNIPPGQYEFTDTARPYAVGYLEVLAR